MNRSDFSPNRTGLPRQVGVEPGVGPEPTRRDLSTYCPQPSEHPVLADPAAPMVGPIVILAFPTIHRDCQRPTLTAFTQFEGARLRGV